MAHTAIHYLCGRVLAPDQVGEMCLSSGTWPRTGAGQWCAGELEGVEAGTTQARQMTVRIGYALALAAAAGAPIRVADQIMDQLAVPGQDDLAGQFTRDVPLPG
jgi:hypothetical protein